ncbi:Shikimate O-hydroxycinnamoyltransferase [Citrus sinensis]|uniref:Shikimate O-hydroxycinnamoyltransferase n=1 Tax=Citrus sinensis TaxID=2711 RepID=A0ACB8P868_CITSI|nr:Shikimate O-hydroxycinnamoyltransferase [Citrus sinensis]
MEIHIKESTIVRPAKDTPKHRLWISDLDLFMATYHVPLVYFYQRPSDCSNFFDAGILKEALSNALVPFYPIAGRLGWNESGRLEISDFMPSSQLQQLVPAVDYTKDITSHPLLVLQVTYFKCGGACLGVGFHHTLADGTSTLHFIDTWADMARGFPMTSTPLIDRTIVRARVPPSPSFHHTEYDPPLSMNNPTQIKEFKSSPVPTSVATLKLSLDQINTLKASVKKDHLGTDINYSTYEVLAAHIWRCMCRARKLPSTQASKFYISMSGRSRLNPPIPSTYFGNVIFFTTPIALSGDIQSEQLIK